MLPEWDCWEPSLLSSVGVCYFCIGHASISYGLLMACVLLRTCIMMMKSLLYCCCYICMFIRIFCCSWKWQVQNEMNAHNLNFVVPHACLDWLLMIVLNWMSTRSIHTWYVYPLDMMLCMFYLITLCGMIDIVMVAWLYCPSGRMLELL